MVVPILGGQVVASAPQNASAASCAPSQGAIRSWAGAGRDEVAGNMTLKEKYVIRCRSDRIEVFLVSFRLGGSCWLTGPVTGV